MGLPIGTTRYGADQPLRRLTGMVLVVVILQVALLTVTFQEADQVLQGILVERSMSEGVQDQDQHQVVIMEEEEEVEGVQNQYQLVTMEEEVTVEEEATMEEELKQTMVVVANDQEEKVIEVLQEERIQKILY